MFEKESEEYADWFWGASQSAQRAIKQAYQQGAEFVYNKCNAKLVKAKELIKDLINSLEVIDGEQIRELKVVKEAEQFLINLERYENDK